MSDFERVLAVQRHQLVAQRVVGCMQRHGERHRAFLAQPVHAGHHPRGRNGHAPARKAVGVVVQHEAQRRNHVVEVEHGLAHAHEHHVGDDALRARGIAQLAIGEPQLADDLVRGEVAVEALLAGGAERAVEHAARLARHAQRGAADLGNEHRFHRVGAVDLDQPLARAVRGGLVAHDLRRRDAGGLGEPLAQRPGEIAHRREIGFAELVDPALQLPRAKRLLAQALEETPECLRVEAEEVVLHLEKTSQVGKK